jgi:hypothetical protein
MLGVHDVVKESLCACQGGKLEVSGSVGRTVRRRSLRRMNRHPVVPAETVVSLRLVILG